MANGIRTFKPHFLAHIDQEVWNALDESERQRLIALGQSPKAPAIAGKPAPEPDPKLTPMKDIRDWAESVDGISGERLRNCIIFQLDEKKNKWYRLNMTPSFVRKFAKQLDDETPIGWTPNPLIATKTISLGDGENVDKKFVREPKNSEEWMTLHFLLTGAFGKLNPYIVKKLAKKNCSRCEGRGSYKKKVYPEAKSVKLRFEEFYFSPCECCHVNPFDKSIIVRCSCGRDISVPPGLKKRLCCEKCGTFLDNPHLA